jgi:hypothetical protein
MVPYCVAGTMAGGDRHSAERVDSMRNLSVMGAGCLILILFGPTAFAKDADEGPEPNAEEFILGKWESTDPNEKGIIEFAKVKGEKKEGQDGPEKLEVKVTLPYGNKTLVIKGTFKFDDKDDKKRKVIVSFPDPSNSKKKMTNTITIKKMSEKENTMILILARGKQTTYKRIK